MYLHWIVGIGVFFGLVSLGNSQDQGPKFIRDFYVSGSVNSQDLAIGVGVDVRYRMSEKISMGPALSYYKYDNLFEESFFNIGFDGRYLIFPSGNLRPLAGIRSGYGVVFTQVDNAENLQQPAQLFVNPYLGLQLELGPSTSLILSLGYLRQSLEVSFEDFSGLPLLTNKIYNRYVISAGISF